MRYAITDIHGCAKTLLAALNTIDLQPTDELFFLGDYIDRGPNSQGVIDIIRSLEANGQPVVCLRGNHEQMLIDYDEGRQHLYEWQPDPERYADTLEWVRKLKHYHLLDDYLLVHAGLNFRHPQPLEDTRAMLWERYWYGDIDRDWLGKRVIVHGHTPDTLERTRIAIDNMAHRQYVGIDSGCAWNRKGLGHLTVLNLDTREGVFVKRVG